MAIVSTFRTRLKLPIAQRFDSLAARLIAAAAIWTLLGLLVGGYALSGLFRSAVEADFDSRLRADLDEMIAAAEPNAEGALSLQGRFADPRFERVYSGWYWQITPEGRVIWLDTDARSGRVIGPYSGYHPGFTLPPSGLRYYRYPAPPPGARGRFGGWRPGAWRAGGWRPGGFGGRRR